MKNPRNRPDRGATRRWFVTLTIMCAAATVTAGVGLNHRLSQAGAVPTSRPLTSAAPAFVGTPTATLSDPSVPDPYEAFRQGVSEVSEPIATF